MPVEPPSSPLPPSGRLPCCLWPFSRGRRVGCRCCSSPFPLDAPGLASPSRCRCAQLKINILFSTPNFKSELSLTIQGYQHFLAHLSLLSRPQCFVGNGLWGWRGAGDVTARLHTHNSAPAQPCCGLPGKFIFN